MNQADPLLAGVLNEPEDETLRLVLADWLEEQGDEANRARADLLRLQVRYEHLEKTSQRQEANQQARTLLEAQPGLLAGLGPLLDEDLVSILGLGEVLVTFVCANVTSTQPGRLVAGSSWQGELMQDPQTFPTTLWLRKREGNAIEGDMDEDFASLYGVPVHGEFLFRGVVVGDTRLAFVTYETRRAGVHPGLYRLRLGGGGWLTGTWWVPSQQLRGRMRLRQRGVGRERR